MTNELSRADGESAVRIAFVRPGQDRDEQVAKLGKLRPEDQLITVTFVRVGDVVPPGQVLH